MQTTNEFLDAVKQRHGVTSDYALAKLLGVRHTTISNYRTMRSRLDDQMAIKVARLLDMPPEAVMVAAHGERAKLPEERELWEKLWQKVAAVLILGVGITGAPVPAEASQAQASEGICIMLNFSARVIRHSALRWKRQLSL
jgi:transcriptional regulator with XRE-family HTH domain